MTMTQETRLERDSMGEMQVPIHAYYGASTQRAVLNFPISDLRFPRAFIQALGQIKQAAAQVNADLGTVDATIAEAITQAAQEVIAGKLDEHFVLDIFQTGSGTSTNMNANEVIANRASELLGGSRGSRKVHPNDHVNFGQSSNDVIPSAIHLSAFVSLEHDLIPALQELQQALQEKADEFMPVVKTGRTHLQDATPIRLGQEFLGYAGQIERGITRVRHAQSELSELALGGTAVGTGVNTHPEFAARVSRVLSSMNGVDVHETSNHFQAQSTLDGIVEASGALNTLAVSLMKIANDIRWLGSGPRAGIGEIELPAVQPGSSIMPGKVNPVIAESVCMVCAQVMGNHTTITIAGQTGNFEINVMMPVTAYNLLQSINLLAASARNFTRQCIKGLKATTKGPEMVERGLAICTSLAPVIGYDAAAAISKEAHKTGKTVREIAREQTNLSEEDLNRILDPASMTKPGLDGGPAGG
ncbi:fumarate hydratase class II [Ktedonospora formicarum]|uniref:Fumarate hydratase class II n=2 Tax=Ktedonospora formicarum TaxID=2778364 RepID=A0A8J3I041_9CHLR|nr:class II fumarate hydratase [Ktedonospora formicarum]GHO44340.1 fumarate hydratase class II [Ktedonospora formicarum]